MLKPFPNFVAGAWTTVARTRPDVNPSDTNDIIGDYAIAGSREASDAIAVGALSTAGSSSRLRKKRRKADAGSVNCLRRDELGQQDEHDRTSGSVDGRQ